MTPVLLPVLLLPLLSLVYSSCCPALLLIPPPLHLLSFSLSPLPPACSQQPTRAIMPPAAHRTSRPWILSSRVARSAPPSCCTWASSASIIVMICLQLSISIESVSSSCSSSADHLPPQPPRVQRAAPARTTCQQAALCLTRSSKCYGCTVVISALPLPPHPAGMSSPSTPLTPGVPCCMLRFGAPATQQEPRVGDIGPLGCMFDRPNGLQSHCSAWAAGVASQLAWLGWLTTTGQASRRQQGDTRIPPRPSRVVAPPSRHHNLAYS